MEYFFLNLTHILITQGVSVVKNAYVKFERRACLFMTMIYQCVFASSRRLLKLFYIGARWCTDLDQVSSKDHEDNPIRV